MLLLNCSLGSAIQALWCLLKKEGKPADIAALTDEHVKIRENESSKPDSNTAAVYNKAYTEYNKYLKALSPLYI
jgi:xylulokinase